MTSSNQKTLADLLQKDSFCLGLMFAFVLLLIAPIIFMGTPNGYDLQFHYQLTATYIDSIKSGNIFPEWSVFSNFGFGDTTIRYYPPLAHYFLAFTQILTNDWMTSIWISALFWLGLGSFGVYWLAKEWLSPINAMWTGMLYAAAPYHLFQLYHCFLYSEFAASAILPFCFLYLTRVCRNNKTKDAVGFSISFALLVLCHIPTTIISVICLGVYAILVIDWKQFRTIFPKLMTSGLFSLALTSFYWLRLISEASFTNQSNIKQFTKGYDYKLNFFPFYYSQPDFYYVKLLWLRDIISTVTLLFILPILAVIIWKSRRFFFDKANRILLAVTGTAVFAFYMSSSFSFFVWLNLSFLHKLQFPFRWLTVAGVLGCLCFVAASEQLQFSNKIGAVSKKYLIGIFLLTIGLFNISQLIIPSEPLNQVEFEKKIKEIETEDLLEVTRTIWGSKEAYLQREKVVAENRTVKINLWTGEERQFEVAAGEKTNARIATFYYPHWQATINSEKAEVGRNEDGTISLALPAEKARVSLEFVEPATLKIAKIVSLLSWILLLLGGLFYAIGKYRRGLKLEVIG